MPLSTFFYLFSNVSEINNNPPEIFRLYGLFYHLGKVRFFIARLMQSAIANGLSGLFVSALTVTTAIFFLFPGQR